MSNRSDASKGVSESRLHDLGPKWADNWHQHQTNILDLEYYANRDLHKIRTRDPAQTLDLNDPIIGISTKQGS